MIRKKLPSLMIVIAFGLFGVWFATKPALAQDGPQAPTTTQSDCAECHLDVVDHFAGSVHALAYADPVFQTAWQSQDEPIECLACHTTGFSPRTGLYEAEGVTCEACHGQTPANHPEEPMSIDPGADVCADCHTTTFNEWETTLHAEQDIACTECHAPHPQALRLRDPESEDPSNFVALEPTALCQSCHSADSYTTETSIYVHETHTEEIGCADCHWFHAEADVDGVHITSGALLPTGHDNAVTTTACVTCHEESEATLSETTPTEIMQQQLEISELRSEIRSVETQGENTNLLRAAQGLVVGMAIGGVLVIVIGRGRISNTNEYHEDEAEDE